MPVSAWMSPSGARPGRSVLAGGARRRDHVVVEQDAEAVAEDSDLPDTSYGRRNVDGLSGPRSGHCGHFGLLRGTPTPIEVSRSGGV
jgi:hypothetical protein